MMSKTDELLSQLKKQSKYNPLNEGFDLDSIFDKLNTLKDSLINASTMSNMKLNKSDLNILKQIRSLNIDPTLMVFTYPNIHNEKKFKINANILFDFVMKKISTHANSNRNISFDATAVVEEAISFTLKYLTGYTPSRRITIDEFKQNYKLYAFGSYTKMEIYPKVNVLLTLAYKTPITISYIDNHLLFKQINNLNNYSKKIKDDFIRLLKNNPDLEDVLSSYMSCIERSIRALINIYKIIRSVFIELQREYFLIFRQLIRLNNFNSSVYNECCNETHRFIKQFNNTKSLNENTNLNILNNSLNTMGIEFMTMIKNKISIFENIKDSIYKNIGLISKLESNLELEIKIPKNSIDNYKILNIENYFNSIDKLFKYDTSEFISKSSSILLNKNINDFNILIKDIKNIIIDNTIIVKINIDNLTNIILNHLNILNYIYNLYNNINLYDNINNKIILNIIIDSIFFNILENLQNIINFILIKEDI